MSLTTQQYNTQKARSAPDPQSPQIVELLHIDELSHNRDFAIDLDRPLFDPSPSTIRFQAFQPFQTYEVPISFRNLDKVARRLKVMPSESPYFAIDPPATAANKVAPGMDVTYIVRFKPDEYKDYSNDLVCVTEREKFVVSVKAIGSRAILDFPDEIHFASCPIKHASTRVLLVRNIGSRAAKIELDVASPFDISPRTAELNIQESMQFIVTFRPLTADNFENSITVRFDTGEEIVVTAFGGGENVNIRLEKNSLKFEPTFLGKSSQRVFRIFNRSDVLAHFEWKPYASIEEEDYQRGKYVQALDDAEQSAADEFTQLLQADPTLRQQMSLLSRTFTQKKQDVERDPLLFTDEIYTVEPASGDIWPNSVCA
jgi:hydrocephalus-inducing protein